MGASQLLLSLCSNQAGAQQCKARRNAAMGGGGNAGRLRLEYALDAGGVGAEKSSVANESTPETD